MAARARMTKSSFIRSGCFSISLSTVRISCVLVVSFGGQASLTDRKSSNTPKTAPTQTPAAASRTGSVLPIFWRVSLSFSAKSSHVLQSGTKKLALPRFSSVCPLACRSKRRERKRYHRQASHAVGSFFTSCGTSRAYPRQRPILPTKDRA